MCLETTRTISKEGVRYGEGITVVSKEWYELSKTRYSYFLIVLITLMLFFVSPATADVPPPIEIVQTESGGLYSTARNISMPNVEVNVTIHLSGSWYYSINVSCSFNISSLTSQNLTTAFVYPSAWYHFTSPENISMKVFNIKVNNTTVNHTFLHFDEFKDDYDFNQTDWDNVADCEFALFNFSINSNEPLFIDVETDFEVWSVGHDFIFQYIVDTARAWEGDTHETVRIEFSRDLDTEIIEYRQNPNDSLDFVGSDYVATMIWDFDISTFLHDRVTFAVQQREHPRYNPVPYPNPFILLPLIVTVAAIVGTVVFVRRRHSY